MWVFNKTGTIALGDEHKGISKIFLALLPEKIPPPLGLGSAGAAIR